MTRPLFQVEPKSNTAESAVILTQVKISGVSGADSANRGAVLLPPRGRNISAPPVRSGPRKISVSARGRARERPVGGVGHEWVATRVDRIGERTAAVIQELEV